MRKPEVTILTPTYNRVHLLPDLYKSLNEQTMMNFEWLIIDDGSTDATEDAVRNFNDNGFTIEYVKKENGGKHTALNYAHPYINGKLVFIVDSDDTLTRDAVETIIAQYTKDENQDDIACWSFLKSTSRLLQESGIGKSEVVVSNYVDYRINGHRTGDYAEVVRTDVFKKYSFPVIQGEKFMLESWLWNQMAQDGYKTVYVNKAVYIYEYLEDGLTRRARGLRMKNPQGAMIDAKQYLLNPNVCRLVKLKTMVLFWIYGFSAKEKVIDIAKKSGNSRTMLAFLPIGYIAYRIWNKKYLLRK